MPAARRLAALLAAVAAAAPPAAALAQGTSTDQAPDLSSIPLLSPTPPAQRHAGATRPAQSRTPAASLPATGADAWALGGLGAALLLAGLGLRLRTRDERF